MAEDGKKENVEEVVEEDKKNKKEAVDEKDLIENIDEKIAKAETTDEADKETPASPLEESKQILTDLKEQNKIMASNLKQAEKIAANMMLNGRAPAGKEKTEDEKEIEEAKKLLEGTGLDPFDTGEKKQ